MDIDKIKAKLKEDKENIWTELTAEKDMKLEVIKGKAQYLQSMIEFIKEIEDTENEIPNENESAE